MNGADLPGYDVPHQLVEQLYQDTGVRTAHCAPSASPPTSSRPRRSLTRIAVNAESSVAFRLELLKNTPRARKVVETVARMRTGQEARRPRWPRFGLRLHRLLGLAARGRRGSVARRASGQIRVHNFWCAIDCGVAVQPDNVAAQTESSIVYGTWVGAHRTHHDQAWRGRADRTSTTTGCRAMKRGAMMHVEVIPTDNPPDRCRPDGDAAGRARDRQRDRATCRRASAPHAVHARACEGVAGLCLSRRRGACPCRFSFNDYALLRGRPAVRRGRK